MDFTYDDEQKALQQAVRDLAGRNAPVEQQGDQPVGPAKHDPKVWSALAEMGLIALPFAEELGGADASAVEVAIASAELGRARVATAYAEALVAAQAIALAGDDQQRKELLPPLLEGESLVVPALSEPGRAWSLDAYDVTASGSDGDVTLTGTKEPVPFADAAERFVVSARVGDKTGLFVVEASDAEVSGQRVKLSGTPAKALGTLDDAPAALAAAVNLGILAVSAEALGAMDAALPMTVEYLKTRKQFGVPLAAFQTLTQRAADMYVSVELARSTVLFAAMRLAEDAGESETASRLKVVTGQSGRHVGQEAIQLHGGIGMTAEYAVGHYTARLTAIEHTFGDTRYHLARLAAGLGDHQQVEVLAG
ncbi:acyl-CoA dehydrogenase [Flexivirga sp. ID2601S]|uniref:Acyl-CoA dehydrogenase n=1 Tax=Flexivirga aerilata TaxID=1656889 RepID=A0A849ADN5_9MICO|nr:acyl-CoA dehydrogenase family protein [Flexivirga aerilata]NNG38984.1 acyl-CoA dehydrogenase [Flexivirga aerilata]